MTSETLVNIDHTAQRNNPEDRNLHTHCCENLKSYKEEFEYTIIYKKGKENSNSDGLSRIYAMAAEIKEAEEKKGEASSPSV
jgi:hypothetical protein